VRPWWGVVSKDSCQFDIIVLRPRRASSGEGRRSISLPIAPSVAAFTDRMHGCSSTVECPHTTPTGSHTMPFSFNTTRSGRATNQQSVMCTGSKERWWTQQPHVCPVEVHEAGLASTAQQGPGHRGWRGWG
jgi:hypothetical protein